MHSALAPSIWRHGACTQRLEAPIITSCSHAQVGAISYHLQNAELVDRLLAAGGVAIGKTNIPAFSFDGTRTLTSWEGATLNAVNPVLGPGASSAGTATAVAAGFAVWGIAEETGGSIQARRLYFNSLHSVHIPCGMCP